ncbi:MAG: electron transporter RnfD [Lachnospiraceae bacterium]
MYIKPSDTRLSYSGRIDFDNPDAPVLVFVSSSVGFRFKGTSVKVKLINKRSCWSNRLGCIIDGVQSAVLLKEDEAEHIYTLAENLMDAEHEVILFKRQDTAHIVTLLGFEFNDGAELLAPPAKPERRIEVYGDSVSCGEVSEAVDYTGKPDPVHNGEFSNSWYSYAWMTARKLKAELHNISQGGIALLNGTGYYGAPEYLGMEECYDKIEYLPDLSPVKKWNFAKYTPHVVIVAIGQNDNHPEDYMAADYDSVKSENWRRHYEAFIRRLMELYPSAQIILTTTILMHDAAWDRAIDEVCTKIASEHVHHFLYKRNGSGTPGHIRIPEAEEMSEELAAYITALGEDIWK